MLKKFRYFLLSIKKEWKVRGLLSLTKLLSIYGTGIVLLHTIDKLQQEINSVSIHARYDRCLNVFVRPGFGLVIEFINNLQVIITNNYYTLADLHNLQSLHTNLLSLFPPVFTDL
jgi:hypothetical protein